MRIGHCRPTCSIYGQRQANASARGPRQRPHAYAPSRRSGRALHPQRSQNQPRSLGSTCAWDRVGVLTPLCTPCRGIVGGHALHIDAPPHSLHALRRRPDFACRRPSTLLAHAAFAAVLAHRRPSTQLASVSSAAVLVYRRPSALLACVALVAMLAYRRPSALRAPVSLPAVLA